ncbi:MAG: phage tail protein [Caldilineaceae bacterium]|nr:phage tail protein [Caldilineaceae bacterium]MCB0107088.1 phage tail protein [Caldilineaceae bacterium]
MIELPTEKLVDPLLSFSFFVEVNNIIEAGFTSCSGMSAKRETMPVQEGGVNDMVYTLPGRISYGNITLKHGIALSDKLWKWFEEGYAYGMVTYRDDVSIIQAIPFRPQGTHWVRRYHLKGAFPIAWTGPNLETSSTEVAVESLELSIQKFTLEFNKPNTSLLPI